MVGINTVIVKVEDKPVKIIGNGTVDINNFVEEKQIKDLHIKEEVNYEVLKNILETTSEEDLYPDCSK